MVQVDKERRFLRILAGFVAGFVVFCVILVFRSGMFVRESRGSGAIPLRNAVAQPLPADGNSWGIRMKDSGGRTIPEPEHANWDSNFFAIGDVPKRVVLGAADVETEDPDKGFRLQLHLDSVSAGIEKAIFSCGGGKGFRDRDQKNPKPLVLLSPVDAGKRRQILSMANAILSFVDEKAAFALDGLSWKSGKVKKNADGSQSVTFEAEVISIETSSGLHIYKTYQIKPGSYMVDCRITVKNNSARDRKISFNLMGAAGIGREDKRSDTRQLVGGFRDTKGQVQVDVKKITDLKSYRDNAKLSEQQKAEKRRLQKEGDNFLWAAVVNKYFAAIVVPLPRQGKDYCDWTAEASGQYYDPDGKEQSGDETLGVTFKTATETIKAGGQEEYNFEVYLGPKDKLIFEGNEQFRKLGFVNTINIPCCCLWCPLLAFIKPLTFALITLMGGMYRFLPNYGVVIIILVLVVRLILHPLTKKGQISMTKAGKLGPMVEQLKAKYANDKTELNRQMIALYKKEGASPFIGMLPMLIQMPIWVALYSAIDTSISLRNAHFLPVWITDLSAPDALFSFPGVNIPLFGSLDSFNLLPFLMGLAFYLQQRFTPQQAPAASNSQLAQQQKIMMVMMPILFPLMLYSAPSGLNLYIMASSFGGAIEQYVIKKHIEKNEQQKGQGLVPATSKTGGKAKKKKPKPLYRFH